MTSSTPEKEYTPEFMRGVLHAVNWLSEKGEPEAGQKPSQEPMENGCYRRGAEALQNEYDRIQEERAIAIK